MQLSTIVINARQLKASLEFKAIRGLFSGGQFNGSSGYEEAAVQGFMAGVNAAREVLGKEPIISTVPRRISVS